MDENVENQEEQVLVEKLAFVKELNDSSTALRTFGEERIGVSFMKGNNNSEQNLKERYAHSINGLKKLETSNNGRLIAMAVTDLEVVCMIAVKALSNR